MQQRLLEQIAVLLMVGAGMVLGGCDTTVPIFKENGESPLYFSLYGQIGPDGGTVRVERLRDSINIGASSAAPETVVLRRAEGEGVDTLRRGERRVGALRVHNYRVPPLEPGGAYRIVVTGRRGNVSSASFTIPGEPTAQVLDTLRYCDSSLPGREYRARPVRVMIDSMRRIGRVAVRYRRLGRDAFSTPYPHTVAADRAGETAFDVRIRTNTDLVDLARRPPPALVTDATVTVTAVGRGWPGRAFHTRSLEEIGIPNQHSTVRNGIGLVVGVHAIQKDIPVRTPGSQTELPYGLPDCSE